VGPNIVAYMREASSFESLLYLQAAAPEKVRVDRPCSRAEHRDSYAHGEKEKSRLGYKPADDEGPTLRHHRQETTYRCVETDQHECSSNDVNHRRHGAHPEWSRCYPADAVVG
jgi:hypothetical protein